MANITHHEGFADKPHGHPVRNVALGGVSLLAALTVGVEGGRQMERRGFNPIAFAQSLFAPRESGSAVAQTVETTQLPAQGAEISVATGGVRTVEVAGPFRQSETAYDTERGFTVRARDGFSFRDFGDGIVRECDDAGTRCIKKEEYRME